MKYGLRATYQFRRIISMILLISAITIRAEAKIALYFPPGSSKDDVDCLQKDWDAARAIIKKTDPVLSAMIDSLEGSEVTHWIEFIHDNPTTSEGYDEHYQVIKWNPEAGERYPTTGLCKDPVASLVHELYHALENQASVASPIGEGILQTDRKISNADTNYIPLSEVDATTAENLYRRLNGLCIRTHYGAIPLPASKWGSAGICYDPGAEPCHDIDQGCPKYCCWVYGVIKDQKTGGWQACVKDHVTSGECHKFGASGYNFSEHSTPCNFPNAPACP
jgi:hypothetical protein